MPNNDELEALLKVAAQRLGTNPDALKNEAESGKLSKLLGNMSANDVAKLEQVLNDKDAANKLLSTPQAQILLQKLLGGK
jgi:hypothetical protein